MRGLTLAILLVATSATAADDSGIKPSYQATLDSVSSQSDCKRKDYPDFIFFDCSAGNAPASWFFTKPGTPAHPGVLVRRFTPTDIETNAHSYGSDDAQPAFEAWMDRVGHSILGH